MEAAIKYEKHEKKSSHLNGAGRTVRLAMKPILPGVQPYLAPQQSTPVKAERGVVGQGGNEGREKNVEYSV